jgi:hypothetical protein
VWFGILNEKEKRKKCVLYHYKTKNMNYDDSTRNKERRRRIREKKYRRKKKRPGEKKKSHTVASSHF